MVDEKKVQEEFEQKLNYNCPASYKQGDGKGSCAGYEPGTAGTEKEPAQKSAPKEAAPQKSLSEKGLTIANGMMERITKKYEALEQKYKDTESKMKNPTSPRNARQLRTIEKEMKNARKEMDYVQKIIDKNAKGVLGKNLLEARMTSDPKADNAEKAWENFEKINTAAFKQGTEWKVGSDAPTEVSDKGSSQPKSESTDFSKMKESDISHNIYHPESKWTKEQKDAGSKYLEGKRDARMKEGISSELVPGKAKVSEFKDRFEGKEDGKYGEPQDFHQEVAQKDVAKILSSMGQSNEFKPAKVAGTLEARFGKDTIKVGRENSPVVYVDKKASDVADVKKLEKEMNRVGRTMKADEVSVVQVGDKVRIRFWWD